MTTKIRILEENGPKGWAVEVDTLRMSHGDEVTVSDDLAQLLCRNGLAEDLARRIPTGERPGGGETILVPEGARHAHDARSN